MIAYHGWDYHIQAQGLLSINLWHNSESSEESRMDFAINLWIKEYTRQLIKLFGSRIWFVGLQGSYGRNEANEQSDIDVVVILDRVTSEDIREYGTLLDRLPQREKTCGFISGKQELLNWEKSDLFQFYFDTLPIVGSLDLLKDYFSAEDIRRAVRIGACNVYHGCTHNMVHEKSWDILKGLYKSASFTLQAIGFLQTGKYEKNKDDLLKQLSPEDQVVLSISRMLKGSNPTGPESFKKLSDELLSWGSRWIIKCGTQ